MTQLEMFGAEIEALARTVAKALLAGPDTTEAIADKLRIKSGHVRRALRWLRARAIVVELPGRWSLTAYGAAWVAGAEVAR